MTAMRRTDGTDSLALVSGIVTVMPLRHLELLERKIERQLRFIELKKGAFERRIGWRLRDFEQRNRNRFDDEFRFLRTWLEKPLSVGAVAPSGKALARIMAGYVDPAAAGPIVELGPGTGPVTEALVERGIAPERLFLIEFDPEFCTLLRERYPSATVVQGDAYSLRQTLADVLRTPAAAFVSGLPLFNKPLKLRLNLLDQAFGLMAPGAPFVQFTYNAISPIPRSHGRIRAEASGRVWRNFPPARVWVYRLMDNR
jgi:phosphatidylethanolamine/phosphatidyl-N-methylethanolamine N-methyltransferase